MIPLSYLYPHLEFISPEIVYLGIVYSVCEIHTLAEVWIAAMMTQSKMRLKTLHFTYKYIWRIPAAVWGLCGENCPKSAKVWKIGKTVEFMIRMISVSYRNLRRLGNSRFLTSNP